MTCEGKDHLNMSEAELRVHALVHAGRFLRKAQDLGTPLEWNDHDKASVVALNLAHMNKTGEPVTRELVDLLEDGFFGGI